MRRWALRTNPNQNKGSKASKLNRWKSSTLLKTRKAKLLRLSSLRLLTQRTRVFPIRSPSSQNLNSRRSRKKSMLPRIFSNLNKNLSTETAKSSQQTNSVLQTLCKTSSKFSTRCINRNSIPISTHRFNRSLPTARLLNNRSKPASNKLLKTNSFNQWIKRASPLNN